LINRSSDVTHIIIVLVGSIYEVSGPRLFTTAGHAYQHAFNISLCGGDDHYDVAVCTDNMTSHRNSDGETVSSLLHRVVRCRLIGWQQYNVMLKVLQFLQKFAGFILFYACRRLL